MKASEFRLGNLITSDGEIFTISSIDDYLHTGSLTVYTAAENDDFCIPLTEEWLKKFGFYIEDDEWHYKTIYNFVLSEDTVDDKSSYGIKVGYNYFEITTVHQLQNIVHALTGSELEIK